MLRKKRVTITEQAQAAMAAGMPVNQALGEHGTDVPEAEETETVTAETESETSEETQATGEESTAEETTAEGEETTEEEESTEQVAALSGAVEISAGDSAFNSVLDRLQTAQNQAASLAAQVTSLNESVDQMTSAQTQLMSIVASKINHMQIALGGVATDLTGLDATTLLAQHQSTLTTFEKRLPVGGKAEVPIEDSDRDGKVVPLVSPGIARATQIRK